MILKKLIKFMYHPESDEYPDCLFIYLKLFIITLAHTLGNEV
jgi:hypothetical protein